MGIGSNFYQQVGGIKGKSQESYRITRDLFTAAFKATKGVVVMGPLIIKQDIIPFEDLVFMYSKTFVHVHVGRSRS